MEREQICEQFGKLSNGCVLEDVSLLDLERTLIACIEQSIKNSQTIQAPPPSPNPRYVQNTPFTSRETLWFKSPNRLRRQHVQEADETRTSISETMETNN
jgi:hypothetical protein